mmetsp:Transcript_95873/g.165253  ORF Transcript_95873/g.165253 Transcript_95873/m.165253 type:complete len:126 (-) Transcript_95873:561-938(-)
MGFIVEAWQVLQMTGKWPKRPQSLCFMHLSTSVQHIACLHSVSAAFVDVSAPVPSIFVPCPPTSALVVPQSVNQGSPVSLSVSLTLTGPICGQILPCRGKCLKASTPLLVACQQSQPSTFYSHTA